MKKISIAVFVWACAVAAQTHPLEELIAAARAKSAAFPEMLAKIAPNARTQGAALVWGQDYLFAIGAEQPLMLWQDGQNLVNGDLSTLRLFTVTENLVSQGLIPPMVHVMIQPGSGQDMRSIQYDTVMGSAGAPGRRRHLSVSDQEDDAEEHPGVAERRHGRPGEQFWQLAGAGDSICEFAEAGRCTRWIRRKRRNQCFG